MCSGRAGERSGGRLHCRKPPRILRNGHGRSAQRTCVGDFPCLLSFNHGPTRMVQPCHYSRRCGLTQDLWPWGAGGGAHQAVRGAVVSQVLDNGAGGCEVASGRTERLGEGAHEDVDVGKGHAAVLTRTPAGRAEGADRVRLVEVEVRPVLLLHGHDRAKVADLHTAGRVAWCGGVSSPALGGGGGGALCGLAGVRMCTRPQT